MNILRKDVLTSARLAGAVKRYHTWPTLQQQTVADHCYHCMRIWYQLWGSLLPDISSYFIWHDSGEIVVGDIPFPAKRDNPQLKQIMDLLEEKAAYEVGAPIISLSGEDRARIKFCELCEMAEFGTIEKKLGNSFAEPIVIDCIAGVYKMLEENPSWKNVFAKARRLCAF